LNETGSKKNLKISPKEKVLLLEKDHPKLSLTDQCRLLGIARSTAYYSPEISERELLIMHEIDQIFTAHPYYGKRRIRAVLNQKGYAVGIKYIRTLMRKMCLEAIYPKKNTSIPDKSHQVYPYLLKDVEIQRPNQVWSTDITYIRLQYGFVYLVAIIDWHSRYVIAFRVSITMEKDFCIEALEEALSKGLPEIFNSDQGSQFTSPEFTEKLTKKKIQISMDGKGRCLDNIFVERLWRSVKYEEVYIKNYATPKEALQGLQDYFHFYNHARPHQSLNYKTPAQIYFQNIS
jgi:putative transposase